MLLKKVNNNQEYFIAFKNLIFNEINLQEKL